MSHGGVNAGTGNDLISNFKKPVAERGKASWRYKERAIAAFAEELANGIPDGACVTWAPSSKLPDHPDYDSRMEETFRILMRRKPTLRVVHPFANRDNRDPLHHGGMTRTPEVIYRNVRWNGGLPAGIQTLYLVDDVITTGSNYKACQRLLRENSPETTTIGMFWAKTIWTHDDEDADIDW